MSKKPVSRYAQFRARQRGEVLRAGDALTPGPDFGPGTPVKPHGPEWSPAQQLEHLLVNFSRGDYGSGNGGTE